MKCFFYKNVGRAPWDENLPRWKTWPDISLFELQSHFLLNLSCPSLLLQEPNKNYQKRITVDSLYCVYVMHFESIRENIKLQKLYFYQSFYFFSSVQEKNVRSLNLRDVLFAITADFNSSHLIRNLQYLKHVLYTGYL